MREVPSHYLHQADKAIISLNLGLPPEAELFPEKIFFIFPQLFRTEKYLENKKYFLRKLQHFCSNFERFKIVFLDYLRNYF